MKKTLAVILSSISLIAVAAETLPALVVADVQATQAARAAKSAAFRKHIEHGGSYFSAPKAEKTAEKKPADSNKPELSPELLKMLRKY